ncbi:transposase-like protein [Bradyrhizobium sp. cir1]|uniref:transposase n=1 Tax=Bradyrhizobium sp. cir1 TaxID=1445730 RepID=UPI001605E829|nr:transposase-like protein [Bradyrhizobium sp. cir1]
MQVNVLGAERRGRWSYDEKVRLVEETLQPDETVCGVARRHGVADSCCSPGVDKRARGDWAEMLRLLLFPSRSHL